MADEKILIEVELNNEEATKNTIRLTQEIAKQRAQLAEQRKALKDSGGTNQEAAKRVAELTRSIQQNNKDLRINQNVLKANDNSIDGLRASISKLTRERNALDTSTEENRREFERLTNVIDQQTTALKREEEAVQDFRRNVGNYTNSIREAFDATNVFGDGLGDIFTSFSGLGQGIRSTIPLINSFGKALIGIPLLAVIAAIASLVTFFTKTREGAQQLERILGGLGGVFGKLTQDIGAIGKAIFDTFTNLDVSVDGFKNAIIDLGETLLNNLINRFKSFLVFGEAVSQLLEGNFAEAADTAKTAVIQFATGLDEAQQDSFTDTVTDYAKSLGEAAKQGFNAADANIRLRQAIRDANLEAAKQQNIAEQNRKIRDDERLSLEERLQANDRVLQAEKARTDAQVAASNARIAIIRNEAKIRGQLSEEQIEELNQLNIEILEIQEDFAGRTTEQLTEEVSIKREAEQQKAQATVDRINAEVIAEEEGTARKLSLQIDLINAEAELQKTQAEAEITNQENLNARLLLIEAERVKAINDLKQQEIEKRKESEAAVEEEANKIAEAAKRVQEAERAKAVATVESAFQSGQAAVENAENAQEAAKAVVNAARDIVKAEISKAIAASVAEALVKVPFPLNIAIGAAAGAAASALFNTLIPAFDGGGKISGGFPIKRSGSSDNVLITANTNEAILNPAQQRRIGFSNLARAGVPGFATGGLVGSQLQASAINDTVTSQGEIANAVIEGVQNMPAPVLTYREFTTFQNRVTFKESRANT